MSSRAPADEAAECKAAIDAALAAGKRVVVGIHDRTDAAYKSEAGPVEIFTSIGCDVHSMVAIAVAVLGMGHDRLKEGVASDPSLAGQAGIPLKRIRKALELIGQQRNQSRVH